MSPTAAMEPSSQFHFDGCQPDFLDWDMGDIFSNQGHSLIDIMSPTQAQSFGSLDEVDSLPVDGEPNMISESVEPNLGQDSQNVSCSVHTNLAPAHH